MHTGNCAVLSRKRRRRRIYREQKSRTKLETKNVQILSLWPLHIGIIWEKFDRTTVRYIGDQHNARRSSKLSSNFNRQPYYTLCSSVIHATYLLLPLTELRIFIAVDIQFDFYFQSYWILIIRVEFLIYTYIDIWEIQLVFDRSRHFRLRSADRSSTSYFLFFFVFFFGDHMPNNQIDDHRIVRSRTADARFEFKFMQIWCV